MPGTKQPPQKLSVDERAGLAEQVRERKAMLENEDGLSSEFIQDKGNLASVIRKDEERLEKDETLVPKSGVARDRIMKEIKELTEKVQRDMPTANEMDAKLGTRESDLAVKKNIYFHKKWGSTLIRIKDLKRRLDPDDPRADDLEQIRPR